MNILFYGQDVNECLNSASSELGLEKKDINYRVIKKAGLFNKTVTIEVKADFNNNKEKLRKQQSPQSARQYEKHEEELLKLIDESESGVIVKDGKIIILENPLKNDKITIRSCRGIDLYINNVKCDIGKVYNVTASDNIDYISKIIEPQRQLSIRKSDDNLTVYAKVKYTPEYIYKLKDKNLTKEMTLRAIKIEGRPAEKYTVNDIVSELKILKVSYGISYDNILKLCTTGSGDDELIIANGTAPVDDIPDEIKILFDTEEKTNLISNDEKVKVDYRNIKAISNVEEGALIAEKISGKPGEDGIDIYGNVIKRNIVRNKPIKAGKGCKLEEGKVIAVKKGRPTVQNGMFTVNSTYSVGNVNMKSGNINFVGDVEVNGCIEEGMEVSCKGSISVRNDIASAKAKANGNIIVNRNIINSLVIAGGYDAEKKVYLDSLNTFYEEFQALLTSMERILIKAPNKRAGELLKILIEQRYKLIPQMALEILTYNLTLGIKNSEILDFIRNKIMGINAFNIVSINELYDFEKIIKDEIEYLGDECEIPVNIKAYYVQNSNIVCTGSILIDGPGSYISNLRAFDTIEFTDVDSVVRGGILSTKKYLKLKNVGSEAGVITKLKVDEDGVIEADIIHHGVILYFGKRRRMLSESGRHVKAYVDKNREIQIEMLKLEY